MTDKEVIMINNVDVSDCVALDELKCYGEEKFKWCKDNPNCSYKRFKRLQAENEELKNWKKEHQRDVDFLENNSVIDISLDRAKKLVYEQALEEIDTLIKKEICIEECIYEWKKPCPDCDCRYNQIIYKINEALKDE